METLKISACRDHLGEYSSALSQTTSFSSTEADDSRRPDVSYTKLLFSSLKKLLDDASSFQSEKDVLDSIPILFKAFLRQNRYAM